MAKTKVEKVSRTRPHTIYKTSDGKRVPGVTTILGVIAKPALIKWANNLGLQGFDSTKYVDALAAIGTLSHEWIEAFLQGTEPDLSTWSEEQQDLASNSVLKFMEWWDTLQEPAVQGIELKMVSEKYRYGGTCDIIANVDGKLGIIDIKTGKAIYDDMLYQVAAYFHLARENGFHVMWVRVVQVGRTEDEGFTTRYVGVTELRKYWRVFKCALDLYRAQQVAGRRG